MFAENMAATASMEVVLPRANRPLYQTKALSSMTPLASELLQIFSRFVRSQNMLSRCANVQCSKPFLRLRDGKLFLVETQRLAKPGEAVAPPFVRARRQQRHVEHFWLCDECAVQWTLVYDRDRGVILAPLRRPAEPAAIPIAAVAKSTA
jgi:hypothetical protein